MLNRRAITDLFCLRWTYKPTAKLALALADLWPTAVDYQKTLTLPIWMDFMSVSLKGKPSFVMPRPAGVSRVDGDWVYDEFQGNTASHAIDLDALDRIKDFLDKLGSK
jgi:hypothetical protein